MNALKPGIAPLPPRISDLPTSETGYPVPWFVEWIDGKPEFRVADARKFVLAVRQNLCWVCGQKMGGYKTFVAGPMCGINRTAAEPPTHHDCAVWSARNCPFLSTPRMVRREDGLSELGADNPAGIMIKRNPGVTMLWTTRKFDVFKTGNGYLIEMGEPVCVEWFATGRLATRTQVVESITTGLPLLHKVAAEEGPAAVQQLVAAHAALVRYLPPDTDPPSI